MDFTLRDATDGDLAAINDIYNHYVLTCTCTYQEEPETIAERQAWFGAHDARHPVIVAQVAGEVVGWGSLSRFHAREAYRFTVEDSVYVRHDMQGRGIGAAILAELVRRAKALGYRSILASISADRTASISLHEKYGFAKVAHLAEVGFKFGRWLDVVYLQKML
jgi:L-amino acid N-acyltransferase